MSDITRPCIGWKVGHTYDFETTFLPEIGPGWHPLVLRLYDDLVDMGWNREVHQVKEKWGGLRFYIGEGSAKIHARIKDAEDESFDICEECGEPGKPRRGSWFQTLCDTHAKGCEPAQAPRPFNFTTLGEEE